MTRVNTKGPEKCFWLLGVELSKGMVEDRSNNDSKNKRRAEMLRRLSCAEVVEERKEQALEVGQEEGIQN